MTNQITLSAIETCDYTWNPVWGCNNICPFCYARQIGLRFARNIEKKELDFYFKNNPGETVFLGSLSDLREFKPVFLQSNYQREFPKKSSRIFVNSMSDPGYWRHIWGDLIFKRIHENPDHTFQIFTKSPEVFLYYKNLLEKNIWAVTTISDNNSLDYVMGIYYHLDEAGVRGLSIEPLQGPIDLFGFADPDLLDWVILGPETGNRKGKINPDRSWIRDIVIFCTTNKIPLFMKSAITEHYDGKLIQEFPK